MGTTAPISPENCRYAMVPALYSALEGDPYNFLTPHCSNPARFRTEQEATRWREANRSPREEYVGPLEVIWLREYSSVGEPKFEPSFNLPGAILDEVSPETWEALEQQQIFAPFSLGLDWKISEIADSQEVRRVSYTGLLFGETSAMFILRYAEAVFRALNRAHHGIQPFQRYVFFLSFEFHEMLQQRAASLVGKFAAREIREGLALVREFLNYQAVEWGLALKPSSPNSRPGPKSSAASRRKAVEILRTGFKGDIVKALESTDFMEALDDNGIPTPRGYPETWSQINPSLNREKLRTLFRKWLAEHEG